MHIPKKWSERLEVENNEAVRIVTAEWRYKVLDCYKEYGNGERKSRNVYTSLYGGYSVAFPDEPFSRYCSEKAKLEEWEECGHLSIGRTRVPTDTEKEILCETYRGFNYVLEKWSNATISQIMAVLPFWKEHKEVEFLCAVGYWELATKKMFYRLSDKKRKEIIRWISKNKDKDIKNLKQIQAILKYRISDCEYEEFLQFQKRSYSSAVSYPLYKYLSRQIEKLDITSFTALKLYGDYTSLCKNCGHSFKDDYWRYPANLREAHNKVLTEWNAITEFNRLKREQEEKKKAETKMKRLENLVKHIEKFNAEVDGYKIYFSGSLEEWENQANALHQCIVACNYIEKVTANECRIAFIEKDGVPVATVQIMPENRIGQFYGDELDRDNCKPSEEVAAAVYKWVESLPILIKERKVA